jgi:hypothetical protein
MWPKMLWILKQCGKDERPFFAPKMIKSRRKYCGDNIDPCLILFKYYISRKQLHTHIHWRFLLRTDIITELICMSL